MSPRPSTLPYVAWCLLLVLALPVVAAVIGARWILGRGRVGLGERLAGARVAPRCHGTRVWVHACSVGEVSAAGAIVRALRERQPGVDVVLTVITAGGHEAGQRAGVFDHVHYLPFDLPVVMGRFVRRVGADLFVVVETELWPVMLHAAARTGVPLLLVHGRISDKSLPGYRRIRGATQWMLAHFDRILAQSRRDATRLEELGAIPARVAVMGNAKYDGAPAALSEGDVAGLRSQYALGEAPVWVVGSTRSPAEERLVLEAFTRARAAVPHLLLLLAPRHVTRVAEVLALAQQAGVAASAAGTRQDTPCRVLDTMGVLSRLYAVGSVAFVGHSLVPPGGGQNLIEPLAQGVPVLVGPWTSDFQDTADMAIAAGVACRVRDATSLATEVVRHVTSPPDAAWRARAISLVSAQRGAAARYAEAMVAAAGRGNLAA